MFRALSYYIYDHPVISGISGSVVTFTFSMINIPKTTEYLELFGVVVKDIGIMAGSIVAVASLFAYANKHWFKSNQNERE